MSTDILQCKECGRIFQSMGAPICSVCAEEMDRLFGLVQNYLYAHPDANIVDVSKETGVSEKKILHFLKEEMLAVNGSQCALSCSECGNPISSGTYCEDCRNGLANALNSAYQPSTSYQPEKKEREQGSGLGNMNFDFGEK